ncbi:alkaline-phosphatase-like protein [Chiua virens]|nr:alkaline-phosphatase-like protein [Chiua virens]
MSQTNLPPPNHTYRTALTSSDQQLYSYPLMDSDQTTWIEGLTPHLTDISTGTQGIHAEYMKPIFPTLTFPNHWTLLTGLYAASHGIIANDFYDPQYRSTFVNNQPGAGEPRWWLGESIWETVERAGLYSANIMWPGPSTSTSGVTPKYHVPFMPFYPPEGKIFQVLEWMDLPLEQRPRLITVYEPMLDRSGHTAGPESELVNETLPIISNFAHTLVRRLHHERNLSHIVDILFVSDHGMEDTSSWGMVYMDDILCHEQDARERGWPACAGIQHVDGWPSMGFWFRPDVNTTATLSRLVSASKSGKFDVYTTDTYTRNTSSSTIVAPTMPERYHYASSPRLAPIWVIPRIGYALTDRVENGSLMSIGNHGYDNDAPSMRAVFISQGPFAEGVRKRIQVEASQIQACVLPPFENVQLYNLLARLLGIETWASENNGTVGFWDRWT